MIRVQSIIESILYNMDESYSRQHSNNELIDAINSVLRYVNVSLINVESSYIANKVKLKPNNGVAKLPSDFGKFDSIEEDTNKTYEIMGNKIYIENPTTLKYYRIINEVSDVTDEIDLPAIFLDMFVRFSTMLLRREPDKTGGSDGMAKLIADEIHKMTASDASRPIDRPMQFYV